MRRLPNVHQATLKAVVEHLARVNACSEKNKMDAKNLAIVFGGVIFGEDEIPKGGDLLSVQTWKDSLMEDLITHAGIIFADHGGNNSPPLPPTPLGEPTPQYSYGSKSTKVANVNEDFTPRLPPRPANSIHPSARSQTSPTKDRRDPTMSPPRHSRLLEEDTPSSPSASSAAIDTDTDDGTTEGSEETPSSSSTMPSRSPALSLKTPLPSIGEDTNPPTQQRS